MNAAVVILAPLAVSAYTLALGWSLGAANVAAAAVVLCLLGAVLRRYGLVVGGAFVALANYGAAVIRTETISIWPGLGIGIVLFVLLESAYDSIVSLRVKVPWKTYKARATSTARTIGIAAGAVLLCATLGYNASLYLGGSFSYVIALGAALSVIVTVGGLILYRTWRDLPREREDRPKRE